MLGAVALAALTRLRAGNFHRVRALMVAGMAVCRSRRASAVGYNGTLGWYLRSKLFAGP